MLIRREAGVDRLAVAHVHGRAFPTEDGRREPVEVALVEQLRQSTAWLPRLSLVAIVAGDVVGHVVCSRAGIGPQHRPALGLGPLGVHPAHQGRGIGAALMHAVLGAADACDEPLVALLGEPAYYRRFGFVPAAGIAIEAPDDTWGDYFQVRTLSGYSPALRGRFAYAAPFSSV
ncbi:MAG TPA: N-acetyltransferase [Euzebyales bacterium]|nr:N-acetyltransferase [Euzebyales bacterium]